MWRRLVEGELALPCAAAPPALSTWKLAHELIRGTAGWDPTANRAQILFRELKFAVLAPVGEGCVETAECASRPDDKLQTRYAPMRNDLLWAGGNRRLTDNQGERLHDRSTDTVAGRDHILWPSEVLWRVGTLLVAGLGISSRRTAEYADRRRLT